MIVVCSKCRQKLKADDNRAGQVVNCPSCRAAVTLELKPSPSKVETPPAPVPRTSVFVPATPPPLESKPLPDLSDDDESDELPESFAADDAQTPAVVPKRQPIDFLKVVSTAIAVTRDVACICCLPLIAVGLFMLLLKPEPVPHPDFFEYSVEFVEDTFMASIELDKLGKDGWEIASARRASSGKGVLEKYGYEYVLKRRLPLPREP